MTQNRPFTKPKLTAAEQRQRCDDRIACVRLRTAIGQELEERGISTSPAAIGETLGMSAEEAIKLFTRRKWREGDVARLQAGSVRLGIKA